MSDISKLKLPRLKTLSTFAILLLAISGIMAITPAITAQTEASPIPTNAYVTVSPNPVGVNQQVTILMWLVQIEPTAMMTAGGRWGNYTVLITAPDGKTQTQGPFTADDASFTYTTFTPDQIGNYTVKFSFPGKHVVGILASLGGPPVPINMYYGASSFTATLTVQEEPVTARPQPSLPEDYWTRPINSQNFDWYQISGNWLGTGAGGLGGSAYNASGNFNPFTKVPNTAHIVWTKPLLVGGLIGGQYGGTPTSHYYSGKSYEAAFRAVAIINGVLYYNYPALNPGDQGFYAVDLRTGKTLWHQNITNTLRCGQVYNYLSPNQEGGIAYLWSISGSTWYMYDAFTGNLILTITNAISGSINFCGGGNIVEGPNGELLVYVLDSANNWLAMWNSSLCLEPFPWMWRPPRGGTVDWQGGVQWNVTINGYPAEALYFINSGVILATTGGFSEPMTSQMEIAYDMTTGEELWVENRTVPFGATGWGLMGAVGNGIYAEYDKGAMQWTGYNVHTGKRIWGPTEAYPNPWASLPTNDFFSMIAYDTFYAFTVDGIHAHDIETGERLWDFYGDLAGVDFPGYSTLPFENNMLYTIADGKIIASTGDSHGVPQYRGARLYVVDALNGTEVWSVGGYYQGTMPVADGHLVAFNAYDNQMYCFGKGQTATTISASPKVSVHGDSVLIEGTVTDQSPGDTCLGIPAAGTPAIADESMSDWMDYLYMQQLKPTNATGVEVVLETLDPNGNFYEIGRTTSDANGMYSYAFTPEVPGVYTIIATFEGSESYFSSVAETAMNVEEMPQASPTPTPPPPGMTDTYVIGFGSAALVAIIVIGLILILRKR